MNDYDRKNFVKDTLVSFYSEQQNMARHHEEQRGTVSTIFCGLAAADIGLIGALLEKNRPFDAGFLPLTLILTFLGVLGFLITMKLFERSASHFELSEAYLQTINSLISEDVIELIDRDKTQKLKYVEDARGEIGVTRRTEGSEPMKENPILTRFHNPVDPRPIVEPKHNQSAVYWKINFAKQAWLDLFKLWSYIYAGFTFTGIVLSSYIALGEISCLSRPCKIMFSIVCLVVIILTTFSGYWIYNRWWVKPKNEKNLIKQFAQVSIEKDLRVKELGIDEINLKDDDKAKLDKDYLYSYLKEKEDKLKKEWKKVNFKVDFNSSNFVDSVKNEKIKLEEIPENKKLYDGYSAD